MITGKDLIGWGHKPGPWFAAAIADANDRLRLGHPISAIEEAVRERAPKPVETIRMRTKGAPYSWTLRETGADELVNAGLVGEAMGALTRVPTVVSAAVLPDACPAGTIPVGGVVATKDAIHPGFHSADICCSVALTNFGAVDPKLVLDRAHAVTHFGPGGRSEHQQPPPRLMRDFERNRYLKAIGESVISHFATQGDGNHFLYVGSLKSSGDTVVVTHHGSRKPGAMLYKAGMRAAEGYRRRHAPEVPVGAAWLPFESEEGRAYWEALELIGEWTRESHCAIHDLIDAGLPGKPGSGLKDWFWNEHNFIFRRDDGLFYHAKGATPGWSAYPRTLVPLNMAEPILITRGLDASRALGFLPHGAGRNLSRTKYLARHLSRTAEEWAEETKGIDARFYSGVPDLSELPSAYKNAKQMRADIEDFGLAEIIDEVVPYGCIMAGDWQTAWRRKQA